MSIFSGTFVSNMTVILVPFAAMVAFLYYEIQRYEKENKPQDTRLYQPASSTQLKSESFNMDQLTLIIID